MSRVFISPLATPFHSLVSIFPIPSRYISIFRAPPPRYFSPSLMKKPVYDAGTRTLTLNYPLAQYPALLDLLRNQTVYCQFLAYPNGHVWADLHTGAVRAR